MVVTMSQMTWSLLLLGVVVFDQYLVYMGIFHYLNYSRVMLLSVEATVG